MMFIYSVFNSLRTQNLTINFATIYTKNTTAGEGLLREFTYTNSGVRSSAVFFSFDSPIIDDVTPDNGATGGQEVIVITGSNFGASPGSVSIGSKACTIVTPGTDWTNTRIQCLTPAGQGVGRSVFVVSVLSSTASTFNYNPPAVTHTVPLTAVTNPSAVLTVHGDSFGRCRVLV
jgi:hypothetical protein